MSKIKICGLSRPCDMEYANLYRPDYIGFVFAESRRRVTDREAKYLKSLLDRTIKSVGVFVNDDIEHIAQMCKSGVIDLVQLHGDEDESYIKNLRALTVCPIIKAVRVRSADDIIQADSLSCDFLLLDAYSKDMYGGSGTGFDHGLIPDVSKPFFVAGGLDAANVRCVCNKGYYALDISSGVETDGFKDGVKIKQIIDIIRSEEA